MPRTYEHPASDYYLCGYLLTCSSKVLHNSRYFLYFVLQHLFSPTSSPGKPFRRSSSTEIRIQTRTRPRRNGPRLPSHRTLVPVLCFCIVTVVDRHNTSSPTGSPSRTPDTLLYPDIPGRPLPATESVLRYR